MYRKNRVLKKMIEEHVNKNHDSGSKSKSKRYYVHSSMDFDKEMIDSNKNMDVIKPTKGANGNIVRARGSTGDLKTYYNQQTPASYSHKESVTTKYNSNGTPFSGNDGASLSRIRPTNKLSTKEVNDDIPPKDHESFDESMMEDSQYNYDVGDSEDGPSYKAEIIKRGLNFTNHKQVLNQNLDEFMDKQLQNVAEKLAEKKSIEKYNMVLRINMKNNMDDIQEMLDDSNNIQQRLIKENNNLQELTNEWDGLEIEIHDTLRRIEELKAMHADDMSNLENLKSDLYENLSHSRDQFLVQRERDEKFIEGQKNKIDVLQDKFKRFQVASEKLGKNYGNAGKKIEVSVKSLKNKNKLLEEMINEGKVWQKVQSPQVVNELTKILSTSEINKKFQKICEGNVKFKLKKEYDTNFDNDSNLMKRTAISATNINRKAYDSWESKASTKRKRNNY